MIDLQLYDTQVSDLDYVLAAESHDENRPYIIPWSRETHLQAIYNPDMAHLIVQNQIAQNQIRVGYVILAGLLDPNQSIEFRRIVVTEKSQGYGKATVEIIKVLAFEGYQAHRLWLDVKIQNHRAQAVYQQAGFVVEGTLRECLKTGDQYESLLILSILQHEYQKQVIALENA